MNFFLKMLLALPIFWLFRTIQKNMYLTGEKIKAWALEYKKTREPKLKRKVLIASGIFFVVWAITLIWFIHALRILWNL
ncbi:hypothetical protein DRP04_06065 [Archaeoglobales archaeon]|nr:MAG: hypothetical protein DRP04_06065 [Archaeoglobales archaeon]